MKLVTLRTQALELRERFLRQYRSEIESPPVGWAWSPPERLRKIDALNLSTATPKQIAKVMGGTSWCEPKECDSCRGVYEVVVEVNSRLICEACLRHAIGLIEQDRLKASGAQP